MLIIESDSVWGRETYHSQWFAVEILAMATLSLTGATSVAYKKLAPRKPMGMKKLNKKMKSTLTIWAARSDLGKDVATAKPVMHADMPTPLNMKTALRPNRSIVKKATKQLRNFHVKQPPERMRDVSGPSERPCWKMTVE